MSTRLELEDLPPRYRAQAEKQIADRRARKAPAGAVSLEAAAKAAGEIGKTFESKGEYDFYIGTVLPGIQSGRIIKATPHVAFPLLPAKDFCAVHLPAARYTADYVLEYADGTVEVVEIKSKFTRRAQRDYIYRRRLFIDLIAEPRGYAFREIITPDTKNEIKEWNHHGKKQSKSAVVLPAEHPERGKSADQPWPHQNGGIAEPGSYRAGRVILLCGSSTRHSELRRRKRRCPDR